MWFFYCRKCDPFALEHIRDKKFCEGCQEMLRYRCETGLEGRFDHYARHAKSCLTCPEKGRGVSQAGKAALRDADQRYRAALAKQEPAATWHASEERLRMETGIGLATFDLVLRATSEQLTALHGGKKYRDGKLLLSDRNMLLLLLSFMKENYTERRLRAIFGISAGGRAYTELLHRIAEVVAPHAERYVPWPPRVRRTIHTGKLAGVGMMVDTTTVKIHRPGKGEQHRDRKTFFYGKERDWRIKFQVTVGLDGMIADHSDAYPSATADRKIFEESKLPALLEDAGVLAIGDSHYSLCENVIGKKVGKQQAVAFKARNKEIDSVRAFVENANARLKQFKVLGGTCRVDRHDLQFYTWVISIACGLLNLEVAHAHPIRKRLSRLKPAMATRVRQRKRKRRMSSSESPSSSASEGIDGAVAEPENEGWQEIDTILSHYHGRHKGQDVIWYRVRFLGGAQRMCLAEFISQAALDHYHKHHPV